MEVLHETSEPIVREWAIVLTFRKHDVDVEQAKKQAKAMFTALRSMAIRHNWFYKAVAVVSCTNPRTGRKERTHIHFLLFALPGATVKNWIKEYWYSRQGIVECEPLRNQNQLLLYMVAQGSAIFEQERTHPKLINNEEYSAEWDTLENPLTVF